MSEFGNLKERLSLSLDPIIITDPKGMILQVSRGFTHVTGFESKDVLGKSPKIWRTHRHEDSFYKEMWNSITKGKTWRGDVTNFTKDGTRYEAELSIVPVHYNF